MSFFHEIADLLEDLGLDPREFNGVFQVWHWGPCDQVIHLDRETMTPDEWNCVFDYAQKHTRGWTQSLVNPTTIEWVFKLESGGVSLKAEHAIDNVVGISHVLRIGE